LQLELGDAASAQISQATASQMARDYQPAQDSRR
jgi:hypothetical protein